LGRRHAFRRERSGSRLAIPRAVGTDATSRSAGPGA
jgi:hypothetical protein